MLTPHEYVFVDDEATAEAMGVPWTGQPLGLLLCHDESGGRTTFTTFDVEYLRMLRDGRPDPLAGVVLPSGKFTFRRNGWPDDWA